MTFSQAYKEDNEKILNKSNAIEVMCSLSFKVPNLRQSHTEEKNLEQGKSWLLSPIRDRLVCEGLCSLQDRDG